MGDIHEPPGSWHKICLKESLEWQCMPYSAVTEVHKVNCWGAVCFTSHSYPISGAVRCSYCPSATQHHTSANIMNHVSTAIKSTLLLLLNCPYFI